MSLVAPPGSPSRRSANESATSIARGATPRSFARTLDVLRALAEETRLRIVHLVRHAELTMSDLGDVLGQSQPRVSRHVRLLAEAGIVERSREGSWVFVRLSSASHVNALVDAALGAVDSPGSSAADPRLAEDLRRLADVREQRTRAALDYFERIAPSWDEEGALHVPPHAVERAILELLGNEPLGNVCDLGTGTGRMLALLGERCSRAVGVDASHAMLQVARANLLGGGAAVASGVARSASLDDRRLEFRQGDVYSPPLEPRSFDLVVLHQVLHYLDDPARAVREAARLVSPGGRLLVVDFAPHSLDFLRSEHAHRRLGFSTAQVDGWFVDGGLEPASHLDLVPSSTGPGLTVSVWLAAKPADAHEPSDAHDPTDSHDPATHVASPNSLRTVALR